MAIGMMRGVRPRPGGRPPAGIARRSHAERAGEGLGRGPVPSGDPPLARPRKGPTEVPARLPGPPRRGLPLSRRPGASPAWQPPEGRGCSLAGRCYCQSHVITASSVPFRVSLFKAPGLICPVSPQLT